MPIVEDEAKIVGFCNGGCSNNVILYKGKWSCSCQQTDGGVTRWRRTWTRWEERT